MKNYMNLIIILFFTGCAGYSQITQEEGYFEYVEEHQLNKTDAYNATLEWIATNYGDSKEVVQFKNEEQGKIIGKGIGTYCYDALCNVEISFYYTLTVINKDSRSKFEFQTQNTVGGTYNIQKGNLEDIEAIYQGIKSSIITYFNEYGDDDF